MKLRLIWLELTTCHQIWTLDIFWTPRAITFCAEILEISRGPRSRKNLVFHAKTWYSTQTSRTITQNHADIWLMIFTGLASFQPDWKLGVLDHSNTLYLTPKLRISFQKMYFNPKLCMSFPNMVLHSKTSYFFNSKAVYVILKLRISFQNFVFHSKTSYFIPKHRISLQHIVFEDICYWQFKRNDLFNQI